MDLWTIETLGVPGIVLMEHAGRAVAERITHHLKAAFRHEATTKGPVVILAGPGNNGGDGWVCARHLWDRQIPCVVLSMRSPKELNGDARLAADMFTRCAHELGWQGPGMSSCWEIPQSTKAWCERLDALQPCLVVDALFGTGLTRPLAAPVDALVHLCQTRRWPVWSVDMPSGLPTDGKAPMGPVFQAHTCITFGKQKIAHVSEPGKSFCGQVQVANIGLHDAPDDTPNRAWRVPCWHDYPVFAPHQNAHKGHFGHVGVVAGSPRTAGASQLAAYAALRVGAGLVTRLVAPPICPEPAFPECMLREFDASDRLAGIDALVIGPGLGTSKEAHSRAESVMKEATELSIPLVVDADALPLCKRLPRLRGVATPHPGEAARLLKTSAQEVQQDRLTAARALREMSAEQGNELVWVLKGACPIVAPPGNDLWICDGGHPSLAVGGSGDILAGALGAFLARGMQLDDAALRAVRLHQTAGESLGQEQVRGHFARQIADKMGTLQNRDAVSSI